MQGEILNKRPIICLLLIAVFGLSAYINTFDAPFQWDESYYILENPIVKDLEYFRSPSKAEGYKLYPAVKNRYISYLTFALNYRLHGADARGYHALNITIHILNALMVYMLMVFTFRTPFLRESSLSKSATYIALCSALLFVSHPVQTEAVTYIFQRHASLAAFFYLLSLALYVKWRQIPPPTPLLKGGRGAEKVILRQAQDASNISSFEKGGRGGITRSAFYILSLLSAVLAMKTKENAFTLPLVIAMYEFFFFDGRAGRRALRLVPFSLGMLIVPLTHTGAKESVSELIAGMWRVADGHSASARADYLFTQFRVIVTYVRLLIFPAGQNIDYDYPLYHSFFVPPVFLSFLFLLFIFGIGVYLFRLSRGNPFYRVAAFGIFWFFMTLSVESGVIPLPMHINEYRVYLPSVGAFVFMVSGAFLKAGQDGRKIRTMAVLFIALSASLAVSTSLRNDLWRSGIDLWGDAAAKSPNKARVHLNLGNEYAFDGLYDKAIEHYQIAIRIMPANAPAFNNIGLAYESMGLTGEAIQNYQTALKLDANDARIHCNLGSVYQDKGESGKAEKYYKAAIKLAPDSPNTHLGLGAIYLERGNAKKAREEFSTASRLAPDNRQAKRFLNLIDRNYLYGERYVRFLRCCCFDFFPLSAKLFNSFPG